MRMNFTLFAWHTRESDVYIFPDKLLIKYVKVADKMLIQSENEFPLIKYAIICILCISGKIIHAIINVVFFLLHY